MLGYCQARSYILMIHRFMSFIHTVITCLIKEIHPEKTSACMRRHIYPSKHLNTPSEYMKEKLREKAIALKNEKTKEKIHPGKKVQW